MRFTVFFAGLVIVSCSRGDKNTTGEPTSTATITLAPVEVTGASDEQLVRRVEAALSAQPELSKAARGIEVDVTEGIATLRGATPDPALLRSIEAAVAGVPGIVTTLNKVEVRTPSLDESDDTISFSLQRALVTDPEVVSHADHVTIDVIHGSVTLRGTVAGAPARAAVERVVRRTPGVLAVDNRLRVEPSP